MVFSSRRQAFLVDQGYAFKVITQLKDMGEHACLALPLPSGSRRELLLEVLADGESKLWKEKVRQRVPASWRMGT